MGRREVAVCFVSVLLSIALWPSGSQGISECSERLGMASSDIIPDSSITSSSYHRHPDYDRVPQYARPIGHRFWTNAAADSSEPWIQVDLGRSHRVTGLVTQGNYSTPKWQYWVNQIKVKVGMNENDLTFIEDEHGQPKVFDANRDPFFPVVIELDAIGILTQFVRIYPENCVRAGSYNPHCALRFDVFGCYHVEPEQCFTGWEVQNRNNVDRGGSTMVSPDNPFNCTGTITEWDYRSKFNRPFKAIVFRPTVNTWNFYWYHRDQFEIVGINEIPAEAADENVIYSVPECDRIEVRNGDVIGWSYPAGDEAALQFSPSNSTRIFSDYGTYDQEFKVGNTLSVHRVGTAGRAYSIRATVRACAGDEMLDQRTENHWTVNGRQCCELRPCLQDMCHTSEIQRQQNANLNGTTGYL